MIISLEKQIAAQRRELALRKNVYAKRVREGKMTIEAATTEYANALAILKTLEAMQRNDLADIEAGWFFEASLLEKQLRSV